MPVQPEITSPTICASTQTRISGVSPCSASSSALSASSSARSVADRPSVGVARRCPAAGVRLLELLAHRRGSASTRSRLLLPARLERRELRLRRRALCAAIVGQPLGVVGARRPLRARARASARRDRRCRRCASSIGRRRRVLAQREARAGGVEHADRLVGQLAVRRGSGATAAPPPSTPSSRMRTLWCFSSAGTRPRIISRHTSSVGSSTLTTWKRRASAASFSKYFLYSDQVVAAMVRSSPRASAGLSRLAASLWPACAAGADHGVRFVDEQDDRRRRGLHLLDHPLEPVLELALHAGAGLQQRQVERAQR